ncbi:hypothetical protein VTO73DRAFT_9864 [Trametes versicolor]
MLAGNAWLSSTFGPVAMPPQHLQSDGNARVWLYAMTAHSTAAIRVRRQWTFGRTLHHLSSRRGVFSPTPVLTPGM